MPKFTIRNAILDDAATLAGLSFILGYAGSTQEVRARLLPIMDSNDHCVLVACVADGTVTGWVHVFLSLCTDEFAELGGLVVAGNQRGQGIASRLVRVAENWAIARGVKRLRVRSKSTRTAENAFFQDLGFTKIKEQRVFEKNLKEKES